MKIGEISKRSGINAKLIRHYEAIGLLARAKRTESGYRDYSEDDIKVLIFVKRARSLGFSMKDIKSLLGLWKNKSRTSRNVKVLALNHVQEMQKKSNELQLMIKTLSHLIANCDGNDRPHCPIMVEFERS